MINISNKIQLSGTFGNTVLGITATEVVDNKRTRSFTTPTATTPIATTILATGTYNIDLSNQENAFGSVNYDKINVIYLETDKDINFQWNEIDDNVYSILYRENPVGWVVGTGITATITNLTSSSVDISGRIIGSI